MLTLNHHAWFLAAPAKLAEQRARAVGRAVAPQWVFKWEQLGPRRIRSEQNRKSTSAYRPVRTVFSGHKKSHRALLRDGFFLSYQVSAYLAG